MGGFFDTHGNDRKRTQMFGHKIWREDTTWKVLDDNIKTDLK